MLDTNFIKTFQQNWKVIACSRSFYKCGTIKHTVALSRESLSYQWYYVCDLTPTTVTGFMHCHSMHYCPQGISIIHMYVIQIPYSPELHLLAKRSQAVVNLGKTCVIWGWLKEWDGNNMWVHNPYTWKIRLKSRVQSMHIWKKTLCSWKHNMLRSRRCCAVLKSTRTHTKNR